ncbi:MAG: hypothetical protein ACETWG_09575 [Candidatus Neomarinimicrobiota bacterium]
MSIKAYRSFIVAIAVLTPTALFGQPEFFGYYEGEMDGARISGQEYYFGYNKLRLDLLAHPSEAVTLGANLNIRRFHGKTQWNVLDFLPEELWKPILGDTTMIFPLTDTLYLDNVFLKARFQHFDLTVGKQQISLGTGYAWNPTDIFNVKDLMDPTYEQTGITAMRAEVPLGDRVGLDLILAPEESWEASAKMVQAKAGLGSFDFTGTYTEYTRPYPYWRLKTYTDTLMTYRKLGGSIVGQIWELGLWGEGLWHMGDSPGNMNFGEYLLGIDHTFDFQTYMMVEYFHNSAGADTSNLAFFDYEQYLDGRSHSLMQDYVFLMANHPISDVLSVGLFGIANLNDESFAVNPLLNWNAFENVNVSLFGSFAVGDADTEFGLQDWAWRLRLRAYF